MYSGAPSSRARRGFGIFCSNQSRYWFSMFITSLPWPWDSAGSTLTVTCSSSVSGQVYSSSPIKSSAQASDIWNKSLLISDFSYMWLLLGQCTWVITYLRFDHWKALTWWPRQLELEQKSEGLPLDMVSYCSYQLASTRELESAQSGNQFDQWDFTIVPSFRKYSAKNKTWIAGNHTGWFYVRQPHQGFVLC